MLLYLHRLLFISLSVFMFFSTSVYSSELTQEERTQIAAKLVPIITMLLSGDADTIAPDKPNVTVPAPTETQEDTATIQVSGEVGSFVYVNGVKVGVIGTDGIAFITLDLQIGDNLFFLTLVDASGNESDAVDFTVNGAPVIHADRKVFVFPGDSERVVVDENVTLAFEGNTTSWITIDENTLVVAPPNSEEPLQKKIISVAISRDGNPTGETVSFDILVMKKVILLEGDLDIEGGTLYNQWKDISIHFKENVLEQDHHFELSVGLNELGVMVIYSKIEPFLNESEELGFVINMPDNTILYNNYFKDNESIATMNKRLNLAINTDQNYKSQISISLKSVSPAKETVYYSDKLSKEAKRVCVGGETVRLEGFEFDHIWQANTAMYIGGMGAPLIAGIVGPRVGGVTRIQSLRNDMGNMSLCSSRLWSTKGFYNVSLSANEEPVLLVHGFISTGNLGAIDKDVYFKNFAKVLKSTNKYIPFEFEWRTNARFQDVAKELKRAIELIGNKTKKQVHIVAHSFGGVLSRTLIQDVRNKEFSEKYITSLTTVGSPHSGIWDSEETINGIFDYGANENVVVGDGLDLTFRRGQNGLVGSAIDTCMAITCYQTGITNRFLNKDESFKKFGTYKKPGFIPYKLASLINSYPDVPTQALIGVVPSSVFELPPYDSGMNAGDKFRIGYNFWFNYLGDRLISLDGQRVHPSAISKYNNNNIEEHILNLYLTEYSEFNNSGIGIYDDILFNAFYEIDFDDTSIGEYDFNASKLTDSVMRLTDNHRILTEGSDNNSNNHYVVGFQHRTSKYEDNSMQINNVNLDMLSEVGLHDCDTYIGCKHPTWQYFKQVG